MINSEDRIGKRGMPATRFKNGITFCLENLVFCSAALADAFEDQKSDPNDHDDKRKNDKQFDRPGKKSDKCDQLFEKRYNKGDYHQNASPFSCGLYPKRHINSPYLK